LRSFEIFPLQLNIRTKGRVKSKKHLGTGLAPEIKVMKPKYFKFILTLSLILFSNLVEAVETPTIENPSVEVKLAVYTKTSSDRNRIILVGLNNSKFAPLSLERFQPVGATNPENGFEPKYLISINQTGPQLIYSFELGPRGSLGLPKALINVEKVRRNKFKDYLLPILLNDPAVLLVRHVVNKNAFRRSKVGGYLLHLIEIALKERNEPPGQRRFSAFLEALDEENEIPANTLAVAAALTVKYHPNGQISGPFGHKGKLADDYGEYLDKSFAKIARQFSKLQDIAAKSNLLVRSLSPFYALVEYNCQTPPSLDLLNGLKLELTGTNNHQDNERELCADKTNNIPLVIVALNPSKSFFIPLINFRDANSEKTRELIQVIKGLSVQAASGVIPFVPAIVLSAGDMLVGLAVNKTGTTIYGVDRGSLYPQLRMEGDFDLLHLDTIGIEDQVFKVHLHQMKKIDSSEKGDLIESLTSNDSGIKEDAMNETVSLMAYDQAGVRFFKSDDHKYFEKKQIESWEAFIKNNEEILQVLK